MFSKAVYFAFVAALAFAALCVTAHPAYAYIDPGSGLFFVQVIGSTVVGFGFLVRKRVRDFISRLSGSAKEVPQDLVPR